MPNYYSDFDGFWWFRYNGELCGPYDSREGAVEDFQEYLNELRESYNEDGTASASGAFGRP